MLDKEFVEEGIMKIKANLNSAIHKNDLPFLRSEWLRNFQHWEEEDFTKVVRYFIDNSSEGTKFPKIGTLQAIYHAIIHEEEKHYSHCSECDDSGYRRYLTMVKRGGYYFKNHRIIDKVQTCVAACGCRYGRERHDKEGIPWYNDVIKREDIETLSKKEEKYFRLTEIIGGMEDRYEEELPF